MAMPRALPPMTPDLLVELIQPGTLAAAFIALFVAVLQGLKGDIRASEARLDKRIDEVKEEIKEVRAGLKEVRVELREKIKEVREEIKEFRTEIKALENKLDRVLEGLLAVKS